MSTRGQRNALKSNCETPGTSGQQATENALKLSILNPHITCPICKGYFVEATTVLDCLHTFCKGCLLKHFEGKLLSAKNVLDGTPNPDSNVCPKCNFLIHQSHPSHYVAFDRTMQDIVYKLVPGMQAEEERRRRDFIQKQRALNGTDDFEMQDDTENAGMRESYTEPCDESNA